MKVKDIATKEVYAVSPSTGLNDAAALMKRHGVGVLPVYDQDCVVGILTDRDIIVGCIAASTDPSTCHASHCMTTNPICIEADADLEQAAQMMAREQVRRLPVMENDKIVGIISLGDIAIALPGNDSLIANTLRAISSPSRVAPSLSS
ncbi:MAG: CBS domain-containing protein [Chloroflexi bacterium]|nr:CBS domain-containing protein [Chloroflexota bacterium]